MESIRSLESGTNGLMVMLYNNTTKVYNIAMTMITVSDVVKSEGVHRGTVSAWCRKNGVKIVGRDYIMSAEDLEAFRNRRPRGWTKGRRRNTKVIRL
jgi:hypothetical protein